MSNDHKINYDLVYFWPEKLMFENVCIFVLYGNWYVYIYIYTVIVNLVYYKNYYKKAHWKVLQFMLDNVFSFGEYAKWKFYFCVM